MLVDIVLGSKAVWRVLSVLAEAPGQGVTKDEIRKITKLGGNSLFKSVNILLQNGLILVSKFGKKSYYKLNLSNNYIGRIIEIVNLERQETNNINPRIMIILREYARQIFGLIDLSEVYVFGSIVKSSYRDGSDVDIAIVSEGISTKERVEIEKVGERIEKRFGREVQVHFFTKDEFGRSKTILVEQIHRDGIRLI